MHEIGEENRRRSYATVILTVDATLNMYIRRAGNMTIGELSRNRSSDSYALDTAFERFPFKTHSRINLLATRFYSKKKKKHTRNTDIS